MTDTGKTGFFWDERCFWHSGGHYAFTAQVGGFVQPVAAGGSPENPETKRRLKNLLDVSGLSGELVCRSAPPAEYEDLARVHPGSYLQAFKELSDEGGGELGLRAPFLGGGYEIAAQSTGLVQGALRAVLKSTLRNAYALSRPPGHHCLPDFPNGFCLLANIAVAVESAMAHRQTDRVAIVDWDVHHGNGTEAIFYDRPDVLTISVHQERNFPMDTGDFEDRGSDEGEGYNINIPLPPGAGHAAYLATFERIVMPALKQFAPDVIVIACGFDACANDPMSRMMCTSETYRALTEMMMDAADDLCGGRLVLAHEGGYSEVYVPFCGHAVLQQLSGSAIMVPDPLLDTFTLRQPNARMNTVYEEIIDGYAEALGF